MCIGYLNFFLFQNVHSCRLFTLPLGVGPHLFTGALYILRILTRFGNCYHRLWEKWCCQHFPQFVFCVWCCFCHTGFWPNQSALSSLDSGVWMYKKALATAKADTRSLAFKLSSLNGLLFTLKYLKEPHFILKMMWALISSVSLWISNCPTVIYEIACPLPSECHLLVTATCWYDVGSDIFLPVDSCAILTPSELSLFCSLLFYLIGDAPPSFYFFQNFVPPSRQKTILSSSKI